MENSKTGEQIRSNPYFYSVWLKAAQEAESELMRLLPTIPGGRKIGESILKYMDRIEGMRKEKLRDLFAAVEELKKQGGTFQL